MKHYLSLHADAARNAFLRLSGQPLATFWVLAMLAVAMSLPMALYLGVQSSQTVLGKLDESPQITLYLADNAHEGDIETARKLLAADGRIEKSEFVGRAQGLEELQNGMGGGDLVSLLDSNPLPDVFVVNPQSGLPPDEVRTLHADLAKLPMVETARLDTEWLQTLYRIDRFVHNVLWFLSLTLGIAFVLVAHNTVRLQILSCKEEIEITKLLGAPASFIRRPFLYQAALQGAAATAVGLLLCAWAVRTSRPLVEQIFRPYGLNIEWRFFHWWEMLLTVLLVALLGIGGAWLATGRHLLGFKARR